MNKDTLKGFGLTDEQADKVMEALNGNYITKSRFDEVNTEKNQLKESVKELNGQLETLKTTAGAVDALKQQITDLQTANADRDKLHAAELKRLKREVVDEQLLRDAKAIDPLAVKPFLAAIDDGVDDEGYKAVRQQQIDALTKTESKKFLFHIETEQAASFTGSKPGETGVSITDINPFMPKSYNEAAQNRLYKENPEHAKALMKQAGIYFAGT